MNNKFYGLQILRCLAAWLVVFHHYFLNIFGYSYKPFVGTFFRDYGDFGVDIFFVLSGFIMANSVLKIKKTGAEFLFDRIFRIFPAYWIATFLLIISQFVLPETTYNTSFTTDSILKSFLLYPTINPFYGSSMYPYLNVGWTLMYEMFFYITLALMIGISKRNAILASFTLLTALPFVFKGHYILGHPNFLFFEFNVGMMISIVYFKYKNEFLTRINLIIFALIIVNIISFYFYSWRFITKLLLASSLNILFLIIENKIKIENPLIKFAVHLGDISYSTYLLHIIIIGWMLLIPFEKDSVAFLSITLVLVSIITYLLSNVSYKYIETNPVIQRIKKAGTSIFLRSKKAEI
jgi:peptidoglycan/LPS O-acetylase OafA/YrhL